MSPTTLGRLTPIDFETIMIVAHKVA